MVFTILWKIVGLFIKPLKNLRRYYFWLIYIALFIIVSYIPVESDRETLNRVFPKGLDVKELRTETTLVGEQSTAYLSFKSDKISMGEDYKRITQDHRLKLIIERRGRPAPSWWKPKILTQNSVVYKKHLEKETSVSEGDSSVTVVIYNTQTKQVFVKYTYW